MPDKYSGFLPPKISLTVGWRGVGVMTLPSSGSPVYVSCSVRLTVDCVEEVEAPITTQVEPRVVRGLLFFLSFAQVYIRTPPRGFSVLALGSFFRGTHRLPSYLRTNETNCQGQG